MSKSKSVPFLVRRSPNHAVIAHATVIDTEAGPRMILKRLEEKDGPVPDINDMIGLEWDSRSTLRNEIKNRMRAIGPAPASNAERVQAHTGRMIERGLKLVRSWVPAGRAQELRSIARQMLDISAESPEKKTMQDQMTHAEAISKIADLAEENERMRGALKRIERWYGEFPATERYWDEPENAEPMSYGSCFGSNGERDYMRQVARDALTPNAGIQPGAAGPSAGMPGCMAPTKENT